MRTLVGSQQVPYIYEDYVSCETVASKMLELYEMPDEKKSSLRKKVKDYVSSEFSYQKTIDEWDRTLTDLMDNWKNNRKTWKMETL